MGKIILWSLTLAAQGLLFLIAYLCYFANERFSITVWIFGQVWIIRMRMHIKNKIPSAA